MPISFIRWSLCSSYCGDHCSIFFPFWCHWQKYFFFTFYFDSYTDIIIIILLINSMAKSSILKKLGHLIKSYFTYDFILELYWEFTLLRISDIWSHKWSRQKYITDCALYITPYFSWGMAGHNDCHGVQKYDPFKFLFYTNKYSLRLACCAFPMLNLEQLYS